MRGLRLPMAILVHVQIGDAGEAVIAQPPPRLRFGDLAPAGSALLAGGSVTAAVTSNDLLSSRASAQ